MKIYNIGLSPFGKPAQYLKHFRLKGANKGQDKSRALALLRVSAQLSE